jgi:hypothetical protein
MIHSPIYGGVQVHRLVVHPAWDGYSVEDLYRPLNPTVGPLLGERRAAALTNIWCSNTGGTIDGTLASMIVIYMRRGTAVVPLAVLPTTTRIKLPEIPTFITILRVKPDQITLREVFHGNGDSSCCATGRAITVWDLRGDWFVPHTRITRLPAVGVNTMKTEPRSWVRIERTHVRVLAKL